MEIQSITTGVLTHYRIVGVESGDDRGELYRFQRDLFEPWVHRGLVINDDNYRSATRNYLSMNKREIEIDENTRTGHDAVIVMDPNSYFELVFRGQLFYTFENFAKWFIKPITSRYDTEFPFYALVPSPLNVSIDRDAELVWVEYDEIIQHRDYIDAGVIGYAERNLTLKPEIIKRVLRNTIREGTTKKLAIRLYEDSSVLYDGKMAFLQKLPE